VWLWLVTQTQWQPLSKDTDQVEVSFHFAPLQNQFTIAQPPAQEPGQTAQFPAASAPPAAGVGFGQHPFVQLFEAGPPVAAAPEGAVETALMMAGPRPGEGGGSRRTTRGRGATDPGSSITTRSRCSTSAATPTRWA
jgi:hypothetical protein